MALIFGYLDSLSLTSVRAVQKDWTELADDSLAWPGLCRDLWLDKQNVSLEQWVRCPSEVSAEDTARYQIEYLLLSLQLSSADDSAEVERVLQLLKFLRLSTRRREAAPVIVVLREEQIRLENEYAGCRDEGRRRSLLDRILTNMRSPVVVDEAVLERFRAAGRLLTWRESFIASIVDSSRCCITYEV